MQNRLQGLIDYSSLWHPKLQIPIASITSETMISCPFFTTDPDVDPNYIHKADDDPTDLCIDMDELIDYLGHWKNGQDIIVSDVMEAIGIWSLGCH